MIWLENDPDLNPMENYNYHGNEEWKISCKSIFW